MPHLLGFPKTHILDLLTMLYHPTKVPSTGFDLLKDSCSAYCGLVLPSLFRNNQGYQILIYYLGLQKKHQTNFSSQNLQSHQILLDIPSFQHVFQSLGHKSLHNIPNIIIPSLPATHHQIHPTQHPSLIDSVNSVNSGTISAIGHGANNITMPTSI